MKEAEMRNEQQKLKINYFDIFRSTREGTVSTGCDEKGTSTARQNSWK